MFLSNTPPAMTEHETNLLGSHLVTYYDTKLKSYVSGKMSFYAFFFYAGITDKMEQGRIKYIAYSNDGYLTKDVNGYDVSIIIN